MTHEGCHSATADPEFPVKAGQGFVPATHDCASQTCHSVKEAPRGVHSLLKKKNILLGFPLEEFPY